MFSCSIVDVQRLTVAANELQARLDSAPFHSGCSVQNKSAAGVLVHALTTLALTIARLQNGIERLIDDMVNFG